MMNDVLRNISSDETYCVRARRVVTLEPGRPVLEDGAVLIRRGRVVRAETFGRIGDLSGAALADLGEVTLVPGPVNAHVHLELSHLGPPPEPPAGFAAGVGWLIAQPVHALTDEALASAVAQLSASGTAGAADVGNRNLARVSHALEAAGIAHRVQHEVFGFGSDAPLPDVPEGRLALAGHALYSTAPEALRRAKGWDRARGRAFSLHLAEHPGEVELLATGSGAFRDLLARRVLPRGWRPPGETPVAHADRLGLLDASTLAVHAVCLSRDDVARLAASGATVCLCPRSNAVIGVGRAPARELLAAGVPCCLGTDSLASVPDLNIWDELRTLLAVHELEVGLVRAVDMLAGVPARVLGLDGLGSLAPGASARMAVLPEDLEDVLGD